MCPFWKRTNQDLNTEKEKAILRQIHDSGVFAIAFEGGEPLLRKDLAEILAYSHSLSLHTSLITNGTLLESRIDEIASSINGVVYVSLDGLEKTHDAIRGVNGCFKEAIRGITAATHKVHVTINTTIMDENLNEIEDMVVLAKELGAGISVSIAYNYSDADASAINADETAEISKRLVELKKMGYPLVNSINYFKVMAKDKSWRCKPWAVINVDPYGKLVLPCYVRNGYAASASVFETDIRTAISRFDWSETENCVECSLHCYVEPSLVLSWDLSTYLNYASRVGK
jgi:MoaA/NifB/PqqE/SkfB family radical SAM enzyme